MVLQLDFVCFFNSPIVKPCSALSKTEKIVSTMSLGDLLVIIIRHKLSLLTLIYKFILLKFIIICFLRRIIYTPIMTAYW